VQVSNEEVQRKLKEAEARWSQVIVRLPHLCLSSALPVIVRVKISEI
jgi:hypothetical protein